MNNLNIIKGENGFVISATSPGPDWINKTFVFETWSGVLSWLKNFEFRLETKVV